jgi:MFS family permease
VRSTLGLFRHRNFTLFLLGYWISYLGSAMAPVAVAFAVLDLTGSASALGLVLAARVLPHVLLLLVGGVWSDRLPRNTVIAGASVVAGAAQALVALLLISGNAEVWQIVILEAVNGGAFAFGGPAVNGMVPLVVPDGRFQEANSIIRFGANAASIGGAVLAGLLVAAINPGWTVAIDALTFFVSAGLLTGMRGINAASQVASSFITDLRMGWDEFRSHRWLWAIVLQFSVMLAAFLGGFVVLGPVIAARDMDGPHSWALIVGAEAAGFLVGSILMLRIRASRPILIATLTVFVQALPLILLALGLSAPLVALGAFAEGIAVQIFSVYWFTALQEHVAPEALSRVSAYDALGSLALSPLGMAIAGPASDLIGVNAALWICSAIIIGATAAVLFVPEVRQLRSRATVMVADVPGPAS